MTGKQLSRSAVAALIVTVFTAAQAGGDVTGASLREAALAAARQRSVVDAALPAAATDVTGARGAASDLLSRTFSLSDTSVTLDFCTGAHLLMSNSLDPVKELIE